MFSGWVIWGSSVPRFFSCWYPVAGITLWPFVFIAEEKPTQVELEKDPLLAGAMERMGNHERIHIAQATELLVVPFYALWLSDFCCGLIRHKGDAKEAYRHIRLEQEAFDHEHDMAYLQRRQLFAWRNYPKREVAQRWKQAEEELMDLFEQQLQEQQLQEQLVAETVEGCGDSRHRSGPVVQSESYHSISQ